MAGAADFAGFELDEPLLDEPLPDELLPDELLEPELLELLDDELPAEELEELDDPESDFAAEVLDSFAGVLPVSEDDEESDFSLLLLTALTAPARESVR